MFTVDFQSRTPIFEQIKHQVEEYIRLGILNNGDRLPSVRELTESVGVNPNTVQKAYSALGSDGLLVSATGNGCFVSDNATQIIRSKAEDSLPEFEETVKRLVTSGIPKERLIQIINKTA